MKKKIVMINPRSVLIDETVSPETLSQCVMMQVLCNREKGLQFKDIVDGFIYAQNQIVRRLQQERKRKNTVKRKK